MATSDVNYRSGGRTANEVYSSAKVRAHCVQGTDVDGVDKCNILSNWVGLGGRFDVNRRPITDSVGGG